MSFKDILKVFKLERELSDDETALLNTLRGMSESERELLAETLGPAVKSKAKPTATKRVIEKCEACNYTRRAIHHTLTTHADYHEFQPPQSSSKSKRASGIAVALGSRSRKPQQPAMCVACGEGESHTNHDLDNGGHEFTTDLAGRVNGVLDKHNEKCDTCGRGVDENVHQLTTAQGYHEFTLATAVA